MAELILVPSVVRLTRYDLNLAPWPRAKAWAAAPIKRPAVAEWMADADRLPHIWFDDYLTPVDAPTTLKLNGEMILNVQNT